MKEGPLLIGPTLQALYDSRISFSVRARQDMGFEWEIRLPSHEERFEFGSSASLAEAVLELVQAAIRLYPDSRFAKEYGESTMM
jgi:hypothetical protein